MKLLKEEKSRGFADREVNEKRIGLFSSRVDIHATETEGI